MLAFEIVRPKSPHPEKISRKTGITKLAAMLKAPFAVLPELRLLRRRIFAARRLEGPERSVPSGLLFDIGGWSSCSSTCPSVALTPAVETCLHNRETLRHDGICKHACAPVSEGSGQSTVPPETGSHLSWYGLESPGFHECGS